MSTSNDRKSKVLGETYGGACAKLRKSILFSLVQEVGRDICFKCGSRIDKISDLSIEHKIAFTDSKSFYDLNNIAFSHMRCNKAYGVLPGEFRHNSYGYVRGCRCSICKEAVDSYPSNRYKKRLGGKLAT